MERDGLSVDPLSEARESYSALELMGGRVGANV